MINKIKMIAQPLIGGFTFVFVLPHFGHFGDRFFPRGYHVYLQSSQTFFGLLAMLHCLA